ncbi:(2Fe-2S)-binding protein [Paucibacter sp. DJ1R-11]|uniref:(2Fe-2S)-binding protein n=1 Tax=Paucibacter sp. DJ1R-11 TaxID=2893556 RepID=UPI0021E47286|nr:(2Fe-2S)-binding protein [Paucibacter sp. DJ1R-11]MCV2362075.1 (2Fe-2S)-binding protein [Paucibacter sp. DJ1R-11]
MPDAPAAEIQVYINGQALRVPAHCHVAAALKCAGLTHSRRSESGQPRAAFCGMGQCQECRVRIDGQDHCLACMTPVAEGMRIETQA